MKPTRRAFLQTSSLLVASLPLSRLAQAASNGTASTPSSGQSAAPSGTSATPGAHRGLLFDESDLARIRANTQHPRFAEYWQSLLAADVAADTDFITNHVRLRNHVVDMIKVRTILERASFIYVVNRDAKQLALAKLAARRLLDYPQWDMFMEGGKDIFGLQRAPEATIALAFALDWLGDGLSATERTDIERGIIEKGAPACYTTLYGMKFPDRVKGWGWNPDTEYEFKHIDLRRWPLILNATNLKIIPTAALGIAGCLFHGRHPQAATWLELARSSAKAFSTMYGSDGSYDEGVSYWGYTTLHMALFAEVLWRKTGIDDRQLIDYPGTVRYALTLTMPTRESGGKHVELQHIKGASMPSIKAAFDVVNFSDANGSVDVSVAAWVARTHHDPLSQYVARDIGEAKFHYGLIWYDPAAPASPPAPTLLDVRLSNDLVVSRTGWDAEATVLALRSGGPGNHEHADRNSVIFKAHGERLFHDPFHAAYSATQPRWLLRQTEAHTAVLIGGKGHQYHDGHEGTNSSWAFSRVIDYRTGPGWMTVTSDATDAYQLVNDDVARVHRTLVFLKPEVVLILDRVALKKTALPVQVRFQVFNDDSSGACSVAAAESAFRIERPSATVAGQIAASGAVALRTAKLALPETEGTYPFVEAESASALEHTVLTVCTAARQGSAHGTLALTRESSAWRVKGMHGGAKVDVTLAATGDGAPTVTIARV